MSFSYVFFHLFTIFLWSIVYGSRMDFTIATTWDNRTVDHSPVRVRLEKDNNSDDVLLEITAPFFNDPAAPNGEPGKPFRNLWDYEVVEAFFLGQEEKYLEVECSPHGQHIVLLLSGSGNAIKMCLPMVFESRIDGTIWHGIARIPSSYFPPAVHSFNAYAIHGSGDDRVYESLYPVPTGHYSAPNFHRLEFFKPIDLSEILPSNGKASYSDIWKEALKYREEPLTC